MRPRLIYYNDAHHFHAKRIEPPASLHMLQWPVDEVVGTGVDALVFGLEDERFGNRVAGVVSLEQGGSAQAGDILEATRKLLASYKLPKDLLVVPVVPRAPNGKADYKTAKSMMADG